MMGYMKALGMFKKGDETTVTVLRDGKPMTAHIKFQ
jgi:S1-C subfamily serine protease